MYYFYRMERKGQQAVEYMIMVGVLLVAVGGLAGYALMMYSETVALNQVKDSLKDLQDAADRIYALGEGNSVIVKILLPNGVSETKVVGRGLYITATTFGTSSVSFVETDANVHGAIPAASGIYEIEVKAVDGNVSLTQT